MEAQDLVRLVQIIDNYAERGAMKGDEIYVVGQLREKLRYTLKQLQEQNENEETPEEEEKTEPSKKKSK